MHVYDPVGLPNLAKVFGEDVAYGDSMADVLENADACFIFTEWAEFKEMDLRLFEKMRESRVYDGRNCFALADVAEAGFSYYSIGRERIGGPIFA